MLKVYNFFLPLSFRLLRTISRMSQPAKLRVILEDHDIRKLTLPSGIPPSVENLKSKVQEAFGVQGEFALQYMDNDFGGQFFTLCSTDVIEDKDTIKVIYLAAPVEPSSCSDSDASEIVTLTLYEDTACSSSGSSADTVLLSPDRRLERSVPWPSEFPIPRFAYNTEMILERANESYLKNGSLLSAPSIKTDILEKLAETIYQYVAYPSSAQICAVAEALIQKHPCLKEPGSASGNYGWQIRLKYKMGNFRTKLRNLGCPELTVNALKHKHPDDSAPAKNVKKPKKAEVNYLPPYPTGETKESLERVRIELVEEVKKRDNGKIISEKMAKTFSLRREEIVTQCPLIADLKERWPALFTLVQVSYVLNSLITCLK